MDEILRIEKATKTLHDMSLEAVQHIIDKNLFGRFNLSEECSGYNNQILE